MPCQILDVVLQLRDLWPSTTADLINIYATIVLHTEFSTSLHKGRATQYIQYFIPIAISFCVVSLLNSFSMACLLDTANCVGQMFLEASIADNLSMWSRSSIWLATLDTEAKSVLPYGSILLLVSL